MKPFTTGSVTDWNLPKVRRNQDDLKVELVSEIYNDKFIGERDIFLLAVTLHHMLSSALSSFVSYEFKMSQVLKSTVKHVKVYTPTGTKVIFPIGKCVQNQTDLYN